MVSDRTLERRVVSLSWGREHGDSEAESRALEPRKGCERVTSSYVEGPCEPVSFRSQEHLELRLRQDGESYRDEVGEKRL